MIWIQFEITRPVAAIKSLRFALFNQHIFQILWSEFIGLHFTGDISEFISFNKIIRNMTAIENCLVA